MSVKKKMFSKFSSILQHAVDALTPPLSLQEEFVFHWKAVTSYFFDNKGEKVPVEQTNIPAHLEQMLILLQEEEDSQIEKGMYGPCLEYLLQHKLLETLYSLARTDYPPGMKHIVLAFFTRLLSRIKQPLLPHISVHRAAHRLVKVCGEVKAAPTEVQEIQYLCTICAKIKMDPYLVNFFLEMPKSQVSENASVSTSKQQGSSVVASPEQRLKQDFGLVTALLSLSNSADSRVAVKACEGLLLCSSFPDQIAAHCLVHNTDFCKEFTSRLVRTFKQLPDVVNPVDIESVEVKWGMDVITLSEDQQTFQGKRHLVSFLSWLDYCDQLISLANPVVGEALAISIHKDFMVTTLQPALLQLSESGAISAVVYITKILRMICSDQLLKEFSIFLLGEDRCLEKPDGDTHVIRARLIDRCNHLSEDVCLVTLKLFETLILKGHEHSIHNLVLRNLIGRNYYNSQESFVSIANVAKKSTSFESYHGILKEDSTSDLTSSLSESSKESTVETNSYNAKEDYHSTVSNEADSPNVEDMKGSEQIESNVNKEKYSTGSTENARDTKESEEADSLDSGQCSNETNLNSSAGPEESNTELQVGKDNDSSQCIEVKDSNDVPKENNASSATEIAENDSDLPLSSSHSRTEVHKIVNSFLSILPEELKSSYQTVESGYDMYLRDAHKQFAGMAAVCARWGYPKEPCVMEGYKSDTFYEGAFLQVLLDKLSHLMDQSYAVNLQLTSVISKLALVPHPNLHEFLLDPFLPWKEGVRTLFSIFQKISQDINHQLEMEPDLGQKLITARKKLMGVSQNLHRKRNLMDGQNRLEAIIVIEEFCKELSAIAFVKHHAAVTSDI
ncbi:hypothetical protein CHS0354_007847 [Potamilus streckersoni]|uniref:FHF complex subunit HOOK-interacting protein C-terminal domain-containing protein n=1 Tax=Potamilus streckersoni TaxID=2493646 RepID=A0AAE0SJT9_9BIVA|nr:hypothetical protein CHS0354_007847 [Potamilus streckersoni]